MPAVQKPRTDLDMDHFRKLLERERSRLNHSVDELDDAVDEQNAQFQSAELSRHDQHPADMATETFLEERDLITERALRDGVDTVDAALQRIEDGTYGICVRCGRPIAAERLEAAPETPFCISCADELEGRV